MPYIKSADRYRMDNGESPKTPGELNYLISMLCADYVAEKGESYQHWNDVLGALEGCKLETYRRLIAPYEDEKIQENGDVYN